MATNKNARLRYEVLDKCFSNFSRKFYIEDLQNAVCDYLSKELSQEITISRRQIYKDIQEMITSPSMQAPIEAYWDGQRRYYRYNVEGFSIVDLTKEELIELESTVNMLASFRGMPQFEWMHNIISKLKKKYKVKGCDKTILSFDANVDLKGIERFKELFGYIVNEQPLRIKYDPFNSESFEADIHPYYLKQYNNRWYLLGYYPEKQNVSVYPLDRIQEVEPIKIPFIPDKIIEDPDEYFYDIIGVTIPKDKTIEKVVLKFSDHRYPYIKSKPIHPSQVSKDQENKIILKIKPNRELTAMILSLGDDVEVMEPQLLRDEIRSLHKSSYEKYRLLNDEFTSPS